MYGDLDVGGDAAINGSLSVSRVSGKGTVPRGAIMMYSGPLAGNFNASGTGLIGTEFEGWYICDGSDSTPDLRGRFVVGYNVSDSRYDNITGGDVGGLDAVSLSSAQMPAHTHSINHDHPSYTGGSHSHSIHTPDAGSGCNRIPMDDDQCSGGATRNTNAATVTINLPNFIGTSGSAGSGSSHENRPPYYTVAYIQFRP